MLTKLNLPLKVASASVSRIDDGVKNRVKLWRGICFEGDWLLADLLFLFSDL